VYVESYPSAGSKTLIAHEERQCGGLTATALVAAARLGARCAYGGVLGCDELSLYVRARLAEEGIDLAPLVLDPHARPVHATIIVETREGGRTILHDAGCAAGAPDAGPDPALVRASRAVLVDQYGVAGMLRTAQLARDAGIPVVGDFECLLGPKQLALIELVDHLVLSHDFAHKLTGERDPARAAMALGGRERAVAVVTCGAGGSWYVTAAAPEHAQHMPAYEVEVVDTTGCGDVFHGAYAAALARGLPVPDRIRLASATAALKATRRGGQSGCPRLPEVEAFMTQAEDSQLCVPERGGMRGMDARRSSKP
jgi:sugar/nucleoside kinase (ribokinase family)